MIATVILRKPDALLCFPAGNTSRGTFEHLIKLNKSGFFSFKHCKIIGLDEWVNLGERKDENCFSFLKKHLLDHIDYSDENLFFFDGESVNLGQECIMANDFITKNGPIDLVLLGIGMNGHIGLNEPGTSFDLYSHVVNLDDITRSVGQKYFQDQAQLTLGITLGLKSIMEAKTVILQVNGSRKAKITKKLIESEISSEIPASVLKKHPDFYLLLDKEVTGNH